MNFSEAQAGDIVAYRGPSNSTAVARVEVLDPEVKSGGRRGWFRVRVLSTHLGHVGGMRRTDEDGVVIVRARDCWPWSDNTSAMVERGEASRAERERKVSVLTGIAASLGLGTVHAGASITFTYDEALDLARRLGLGFTTGTEGGAEAEEGQDADPVA
jgi:hypothetical protein